MSGSAFPVVVAVALAAAAALAVPPAPTLPGRPAVRAAASEGGPGGGLVRRWRPVLAAVAALLGPLVVGGPAGWVVACVVGLVVWRLAGAESEAEVRARAAAAREADREEAASSQTTDVEDPYDFSTLESGIEKVLEKLKNDLSKLRTGGRFNPEVLENLRVHLVKDSKASEKLGDLAQVLPKGGRSLMILVGEKDVSSMFPKPFAMAVRGEIIGNVH